jgi:polygalacturonase
MRLLFLSYFLPLVLCCTNPSTDACASAVSVSGQAFCATYTTKSNTATTSLPAWAAACSNKPSKISSVCTCFATAKASTTTAVRIILPIFCTRLIRIYQPTTLKTTTAASTSTTATKVTTVTSASGGSGSGTACTVTAYASISAAVASCTNIILSGISAPASSSIDLSKLKTGAAVTFAGKTTFGTTSDSDFNPIVISGTDITVTGASGHIIDGNGQAYWDGLGSNGGVDKYFTIKMELTDIFTDFSYRPDHFIVAKKLYNAVFSNLNIQNWPVHW